MRWIDIIRISVRMLVANGLRSLLTMLGIGVAISLIVLLIGLGAGLQQITIGSIVASKTLLSLDITAPLETVAPLTLDGLASIKTVAGIRDITPVVATSGELLLQNKLGAVGVVAAYPSFLDMEGLAIADGVNYQEHARGLVVTPKVLELLDLSETGIIGTPTRLTYSDPENANESVVADTLNIVGVTSDDGTTTVFMPYSLLRDDPPIKITQFKAVAASRDAVATAQAAIGAKGYAVETLLETLDQARAVFHWVSLGLIVFGTIALIVAAIGMFNTLTISLLERTREIGIMKAVGVTDRVIKRLFLCEAALLGLGGGVAGILVGVTLGSIIGAALNELAIRLGGDRLTLFVYPTGFLASMILYPVILAVLTGLYPSQRASRLNPLQALRYE